MTFEELKNEANRQGYNLVKKKKYIRLLHCPVCGRKSTHLLIGLYNHGGEYRLVCSNCDFHGDWAKTNTEIRKAWNNAVERYIK